MTWVVPAASEIVMVCGNKPLDLLKAAALLPKNRTLNSMRENSFKPKADGGVYMVTLDPQVVEQRAREAGHHRLGHPPGAPAADHGIKLAARSSANTPGSIVSRT